MRQLASERDILRPFGEPEVLLLYGLAAAKLKGFLEDREVAARVWLRDKQLLKRGSFMPPLTAEELSKGVTEDLLALRAEEENLKVARERLTPLQLKIWQYFLPRKLADFFYATNRERPGRPIRRVFFDIDRAADMRHETAREVAGLFVEAISGDDEIDSFTVGEPLVAWTGSSFHVYLTLREEWPAAFYDEYFAYTEGKRGRFTSRWIEYVKSRAEAKILGGHEKQPGVIVIDPSQTPSGKLARSPLGSLHMSDYQTVNGLSLPVKAEQLKERGLTDGLRAYTPQKLLEELDELATLLPQPQP
ncbi:MAG: hypothetical protein QW057_08045 [Candidatus Bathyarchaeia archaeon]